jgi:glutathione synthase/RimK-type ligase-like ATP-grasp enzyme
MNNLIILTDYKGRFGSKSKDVPYRSGYDKNKLEIAFKEFGIKVKFVSFEDIVFDRKLWENQYVLYTSSEEKNFEYKSYIEDVILALECLGAICLPSYKHLRANNNKVFMELFNQINFPNNLFKAHVFGTHEELIRAFEQQRLKLPLVLKKSAGAKSKGVFLVKTKEELVSFSKKIQNTFSIKSFIEELVRKYKHPNYKVVSQYQEKIVAQPFVPNLKNDWKVLIYGSEYYVLNRGIKNNDFRASGSGHNYKAGSESEIPDQVLDFCKHIFTKLNIPNLSVDVAYDGKEVFLIEFQSLYFGTSTIMMSKDYFVFEEEQWKIKKVQKNLEEIFVSSVCKYLEKS